MSNDKAVTPTAERTPKDSLPVGHLRCSLGMVSLLPSSYISLLLSLPENKALSKATPIPSFPLILQAPGNPLFPDVLQMIICAIHSVLILKF